MVEFLLDNDLRHPIQSGLVWPRWGSFLSFGHWLFLMLAVRKLGQVVGLGLVEDGVDVALTMGGNVGKVLVVDAEDLVDQ